MTDHNPLAVAGHNRPPREAIVDLINDLYDEAKNWADGEPIETEEMHDAITDLRGKIHDAGKKADDLRKEEKEPLDKQIKEIQDYYNPVIQPKKGKVDKAKASLDELLAVYRRKEADKKAEEARRIAAEAEEAKRKAEEQVRATSGNLEAREQADAALDEAKALERQAKRADKAATSGLGLRTVKRLVVEDTTKLLDWAYGRDSQAFDDLARDIAEKAMRSGIWKIDGAVVREEKVAR